MGPEKRATRNLAKHLREFRLQKGLSQDELAALTELDRTYISDIEREQRNPSLKTLARLATTLGISIGALCDD